MIAIGGHRSPTGGLGVEVYREDGVIIKRAYTPEDADGLRNEARFLHELYGERIAPAFRESKSGGTNSLYTLIQEDLGESEPVQDGEVFRQNVARLLWTLRKHKIRHGDLTGANIIVKDDKPMAIDFQQSNFFDEPVPQKRPLSDSYFVWRWAANVPAVEHPTPDTPRVIRRWLAVLGALGGLAPNNPLVGKTLLDLGCFQGDFCAMAAVDGMCVMGIDSGGFNTESNSIVMASELWCEMVQSSELWWGCLFYQQNILDQQDFSFDAVLLFSTWPYILKDYGRQAAFDLLERIVDQCGVLFFETQLAGDGPGPDFLVTDDDVANMLGQFGTPQSLVTIPVSGRPANRTIWKVSK